MRKFVLLLILVLGSVTGFAQEGIRLRRPVIEAPALPTGQANIWYVILPVTLVTALVVYICLRIRKRILVRKYSGSSSKRRRHKKRSSRSSSGTSSSSSGASASSSSAPRTSSSRSKSHSSSRSGSSSSGKSSSGQRGSRWTAALEKQASNLLPGQPDVFYMPSPDLEGKFHAPIQKFRTNDRLYQFVVLPDTPAEAVLRFAGNEAELHAAYASSEPEWQIMCEVSGTPGAEGTGFTQQPGKAVLEEGVWVMKDKIRLHFNS